MKKFIVVLAAMSMVFSGLVGFSEAVYFDFSTMGFTDGQNLEGMTQDIATFTSETGDLRYYAAYGAGIGTGYNWGGAADTYIAFSQPVSGLSFTGGDGAGDNDAFAVTLYQFGTNNLLGTWNTPVFGGSNEPEWYTLNVAAANIGRVVFDPGNSGVLPGFKEGSGGLIITEMGFQASPVPLPSALLLFGSGLAGLLAWRRHL